MKLIRTGVLGLACSLCWLASTAHAWDYEGHRVVNELALAALPTNFPAFVRTPEASERISFLAGEPDRWRNVKDLSLRHCNGPDHYLDMEELGVYGLTPESAPHLRYDFTAALALARKAHPEKFPSIDPTKNEDHTRELVGFLPWTVAECYGKLKSEFSYLKTYEQHGGTREEIANAQANVIYTMGVMGHYVGDASQPLHATVHHHGWVGENPKHYTTNPRFHSWIDGEYFWKIGGIQSKDLKSRIHPAQIPQFQGHGARPEEIFSVTMAFLVEQNKLVEPLYQLEKEGKLSAEGEKGREGLAFLQDQLIKSGQLLGNIWFAAWQQAPEDEFLQRSLARRNGQ